MVMSPPESPTTVSVLRVINDPAAQEALWYASLEETVRVAKQQFDGRAFTIRDLLPSDMPGQANNDAIEQSGTDNTYATTTQGDGTAIADDTVICINAVLLPALQLFSAPVIVALRFTVGAALRSQVSVQEILEYGTESAAAWQPRKGWLMTPVIITKNQTLTIDEYVNTASTNYHLVLLGLVAEIEGRTVSP